MVRLSRRGIVLGAAGMFAARRAAAASYPDRPVKLLVGFAPGGPTDVMARIIAGQLGERLGGSFIVENRAGAGGNIAAGVVAHADPDGYTLLVASSAIVVSPSLYKRVPYNLDKDLAPISELGTSPNCFVADPKSGIRSIAELVAKAKAAPDTLTYASPGIGSTPHLSGELLKIDAGLRITHVPFNGASPAIQAAAAGTTLIACTALTPAQPLIASGQLNALAVTSAKRWPDLPNVPTMVELGYPDNVSETWQGFLAPARTPPDIIATLVNASREVLHQPAVIDQLKKNGFETLATTPEEFRQQIAFEVPKWRDVIQKAGIAPLT